MVSELAPLSALFPFNSGKLNALLLPPLTPFHLPKSFPSPCVHIKAPTQGCTFHPTSSVAFVRAESTPLISVI